MNPLETFGEFSSKLTPTDLMLYAGIGIVLWVMFKDQLSPIQKIIVGFFSKGVALIKPATKSSSPGLKTDDIFFELVVSWKQTRDLAVRSGCAKAVEVADQMFPYLSPVVCKEENKDESIKA